MGSSGGSRLLLALALLAVVVLAGLSAGWWSLPADEDLGGGASTHAPTDAPGAAADGTASAPTNATVVRIVDGDTIIVRHDRGGLGTGEERVRLLNIDTPETDECGFAAATDHLRALLISGRVRLETDQESHDRFGRLLAGIFVDGALVNAEMAAAGLGRPVLFQPNDRFYGEVTQAWRGPADALREPCPER